MCEIITILAAFAFTAMFFVRKRRSQPAGAEFTAMLMFWGAALMWSVDCVAGAMEGEPLLDISREDALLGAIILAAGAIVYAVLAIAGRSVRAR